MEDKLNEAILLKTIADPIGEKVVYQAKLEANCRIEVALKDLKQCPELREEVEQRLKEVIIKDIIDRTLDFISQHSQDTTLYGVDFKIYITPLAEKNVIFLHPKDMAEFIRSSDS